MSTKVWVMSTVVYVMSTLGDIPLVRGAFADGILRLRPSLLHNSLYFAETKQHSAVAECSEMEKTFWIVLIFATGAILPFQAGLNTRLGKIAGNPIYASLISFLVGTGVLFCYVLVTRQAVAWNELKATPWYVWLGGVFGALYVTLTILAFPKLGPGLMFGLIVAGQMTVSVWLEHRNILVAEPHPISAMKVLGVVLIIAGVVIIRKY